MGILSGFIGGVARATGQIADQRIARYTAEEMARQRDLMDQEREKRIEEAQIAREGRVVAQHDKNRTDTVKRIDAESVRIADAEVGKERGLIYSKQELLTQTPEWQDKTEQELAAKRQSIATSNDTRYQASINTGDTTQGQAQARFDSERRIDLAEKRNEEANKNAAMRDATERYKAELKETQEARKNATANKRIESLISGMSSGGSRNPNRDALSFLGEARKELTTNSKQLMDMMDSELTVAKYEPDTQAKIRAEYKPKLEEIEKQRRQLSSDFNSLREKIGLPKEETSSTSQTSGDPFASAFAAKLKEVQGAKNPKGQVPASDSGSTPPAAPRGLINTEKRDADIANMNTLSGSSNNRPTFISKKQEEVSSNFEDELSKIKQGMSRAESFKVSTWFDENSGYMTPAQLKQVREAKSKAGM